jgi:hypothetical protein
MSKLFKFSLPLLMVLCILMAFVPGSLPVSAAQGDDTTSVKIDQGIDVLSIVKERNSPSAPKP